MTICYDTLRNWKFDDIVADYSERDVIIYGLGLGFGDDPLDKAGLRFVYEDDLVAFPIMPLILGNVVAWLRDPRTGVDYTKMLHGEQSIEILAPLPIEGRVVSKAHVSSVIDKGEGRGAVIVVERTLYDAADQRPLARMSSSSFARADGGFGGPETISPKPHPLPERPADRRVTITTLPQAALIYRLSGDVNPIHADPDVALAAGFPRPIAHGLFLFGIATRAVISACCPGQPERLAAIGMRFSAPAFPGEAFEVDIWEEGETVSFQVRAASRNMIVLNNGYARLARPL